MAAVITAAADGSSLSNPGPAGWAWYVSDDCWAAGGWAHGTNNMGELMAVLDLLRQTRNVPGERVHALCDSQYVINSVSKWMPGWKRKGWRKADGSPVMNVELLKEIDAELAGRTLTFEWVKGHAGHRLNEAADVRARNAATAFQRGTTFDAGPGFQGATRETTPDVAPSRRSDQPDLFSAGPAEPPSVTDILLDLERALLSSEIRSDPRRLEALLHPDFTEIGQSGRLWTRSAALAELAPLDGLPAVEYVASQTLSADLVLLTWRSRRPDRVVLRSSLWQRMDGRWRLRFHQGTPSS